MAEKSQLDVLITGTDNLSPELQRLESKVIRAVGAISAALAAIKIGIKPVFDSAEFERTLADVARVAENFTKHDLKNLADGLLDLSLRVDVTANDLGKIAFAAGQQGLGKFGVDGILAFTDAVARMSSVLGITAEEAATNVGKIATVFKIPLGDIERASSIINEVAAKSTASGKELLDVIKRIGDAGGALDLSKASAFAATAIDFGVSPEVAGTSITKFFNSLFSNADQFAKRLNLPVKEFIRLLKEDGLKTFELVLADFRKLDEQSQKTLANQLFGGGRQGGLFSKFLQDPSNAVLESNFQGAKDGQTGISSLVAQARVLDTLDAQVKILRNSFVKLGVDAASSLLSPLSQYAAQLSKAIQEPAVKSFVAALVQSFAELGTTLINLTKFVASLNINWENFLKVAKLLGEIKLVEFGLSLIARFTGVSGALKQVAADSARAAAALNGVEKAAAGAATASNVGFFGRIKDALGQLNVVDSYKKKYDELTTSALAAKKATDAALSPGAALPSARPGVAPTTAVPAAGPAQQVARGIDPSALGAAAQTATRARIALQDAELAAQKLAEDQRAAAIRREAELEAANKARLEAIELDYQTKRAAIKATGTETGLKALRAEHAAQIADANTLHAELLAKDRAYYAERDALASAGLNKEVEVRRAALTAADTRVTRLQNVAATQAPAPTKSASVFAAEKTLADEQTKLVELQKQAVVKANEEAALAATTIADRRVTLARASAAKEAAIQDEFQARIVKATDAGNTAQVARLTAQRSKALEIEAAEYAERLAALDAFWIEHSRALKVNLDREIALQQAAVAKATNALTAAQVATPTAQPKPTGGSVPAAEASPALQAATAAVEKERATLAARQVKAAQDEAAITLRGKDAVIAAEATGNAKRLEIETNFRAKHLQLEQAGNTAELEVNAQNYLAALTAQKEAQAKLIADTEAYYARRIALVREGSAAEIAAQRSTTAQALIAQRSITRSANTEAAAGGAVAGITSVAAGGTAGIADASKNVGFFTDKLTALKAAFPAVATAFAGFATLIGIAGRLIGGAFFWVTIIYTALDALGLLDKAGNLLVVGFQKVTDLLGLTSKAQRDDNIAKEEAIKKSKELRESLDNETKAYREAIDARTGLIAPKALERPLAQLKISTNPESQDKALVDATNILKGGELIANDKLTEQEVARHTAELQKIIDDGNTQIAAKRAKLAQVLDTSLPAQVAPGPGPVSKQLEQDIAAIQSKVDTASESINKFSGTLRESQGASEAAKAGLTGVATEVASLFTPQSLDAANTFVLAIVTAREKAEGLKKQLEETTQASKAQTGPIDLNRVAAQAQELAKANKSVADLNGALRSFVANQAKLGLTKEQLNGFALLFNLTKLSSENLLALLNTAAQAPDKAKNAKNAPDAAGAASGTEHVATTKEESEASRVRKAKLELARTELENELKLSDEVAKQKIDREQVQFDRGLISIKKFYDDRLQVELDANANDIRLKEKEKEQIDLAAKGATKESEKLKFDKERAQVQGQINLLMAKQGSIIDKNTEEQRKLDEQFKDRAVSEQNRLFQNGTVFAGASEVFQGALDELHAQYRVFLAQLEKEGKVGLAKALEINFKVTAFEQSIAPIRTTFERFFTDLSRTQQRIELTRQTNERTSIEAAFAIEDSNKNVIFGLETQLALMQEQLQALSRIGGLGSEAYLKQANAIDDLVLRLEKLRIEQNRVANDLNQGFTDALTNAFNTLEPTLKSLKDTFLKFLLDITNQIKSILSKEIAEAIQRSLRESGFDFGKILSDWLKLGVDGASLAFGKLTVDAAGQGLDSAAKGFSQAKDSAAANVVQSAATDTVKETGATAATTALTTLATAAEAATTALTGVATSGGSGLGIDAASKGFSAASDSGVASTVTDAVSSAAQDTTASAGVAALGAAATEAALGVGALGAPAGELVFGFGALIGPLGEALLAIGAIVAPAISAASALAAVAAGSTGRAIASAAVAVAHSGDWTVGQSPPMRRNVDMRIFNNAIRYHTGGTAGLKPDEVPAILQKGEKVLTARQAAAQGAAGGGGVQSIRNVLVTDPGFVPDAMQTPEGEKVLLTFISRNKATVKQLIG